MSAALWTAGGDARLGGRAALLGGANLFDYASQFLLPIVLARSLDAEAFGQYRLLWLVTGTVMAIAPMAMPASLFYFWPRADAAMRRLYLLQALVFMTVAGALSAACVGPWNPWLPQGLRDLASGAALMQAFVALWVLTSLLDQLPIVDERVRWQALATIALAVLRTAAVAAAAAWSRALIPVLWALLAFALAKLALLLYYVLRHHGLGGPLLRMRALQEQLGYATPFGLSGALYTLRVQADQWVVATLFSVTAFASFSIAGVFGPLLQVFRQTASSIVLPSMGRSEASGNLGAMIDLNSRANVLVAALVCPLFALLFAFAEDIVAVVYTRAYIDAAPVMRIYVLGFAALIVELSSLTLLLREGRFMLRLNLWMLVLCAALTAAGALQWGVIGAAWGSVAAQWIDRGATLWRIARVTALPWRRLQDWRGLGVALCNATLSGSLAWAVVEPGLELASPGSRVLVGSLVLAASSAALAALDRRGPLRWPRLSAEE